MQDWVRSAGTSSVALPSGALATTLDGLAQGFVVATEVQAFAHQAKFAALLHSRVPFNVLEDTEGRPQWRGNRADVYYRSTPNTQEVNMKMLSDVLVMIDDTLNLGGRAAQFNADTPLLGALPELDSMAVVALLTAIEDRFGFAVADDEISGETFATVGSLTAFIESHAG
jgi:acyl carrier protein